MPKPKPLIEVFSDGAEVHRALTLPNPFTDDPDYAAARTIEAITQANDMDHLIERDRHRLTVLIEGEIEDPAYQNGALLHLERLMGHLSLALDMLGESLARQGALAEMLRTVKQQRDAALSRVDHLYGDLVAAIATAQECSEAEARDLLTLLSNSDEGVMESDLCDLDTLLTIREIMGEIIDRIGLE